MTGLFPSCALVILAVVVFSLLLLLVALAIYPGELSWLPGKGNQWLYDRAAANYSQKWQRHSYAQYEKQIQQAATAVAKNVSQPRVLDIACGSGRATRAAAATLGKNAGYTAIDSSSAMLQEMANTLAGIIAPAAIKSENCDAVEWLERNSGEFDLLLLMEAAEFIPQNRQLIAGLAKAAANGSRLVMTRPASLWWIFFPRRGQSRRALSKRLSAEGFGDIQFTPWRNRYELVSAVRLT
ncbi:MAG: class I SAM-dependent methyltransferase [Halioglobus sp.]